MKRTIQALLVVGLLALVGVMLWQLRGEEPIDETAESAPQPAAPGEKPRPRQQLASSTAEVPEESTFARDEDPKGPLRLEGQVLDKGDLPLGGATVTLSSTPRRIATTEQDGSFVFEQLVGRGYTLSARAGGKIGGPVLHQLTSSSEPVVIRMRQGATLAVTVVAAEDKSPIVGAAVRLHDRERRQTVTNEKGVALFEGVRHGRRRVSAWASGRAPAGRRVPIPLGTTTQTEATLALVKGVPVSGTVVDAAGAPVSGARVRGRELTSLRRGARRGGGERVTTDDKGAFTIPALAPGTYRVGADHKEHAPANSDPVEVASSPISGVRIQLKTGAVLAGQVVDNAGQAAAWATVRVGPDQLGGRRGGRRNFRRTTTDESGHFRLTGLPRRATAVAATAEAGSSAIKTVDLATKQKVDNLLLTLDQLGVIAGTVVNDAGEPVAEAQVSVMPDIFGRGAIKQLVMRGFTGQITDGGGRFTFRGLPEGNYNLRASRAGLSRRMFRMHKGTEARTGQRDVRLVLPAPGGVKGQVQDQHGKPVTRFTIAVGRAAARPVVDDQGRFQIDDVPPGTVKLTARASGYAPTRKTGVKVSAGKVNDLGTLTMTRGRAVSGTVVDSQGKPVAEAEVVAGKRLVGDGKRLLADLGRGFKQQSGVITGQTDEQGAFRLAGIGEGPLMVAAEHATRGRSAASAIASGSDDVTVQLTLQSLGSLTGKVTYGDKPGVNVTVVASQKQNRKQSLVVHTDSEGTYLFEKIPVGDYDLMAMSGTGLGGKSGGTKVTISEGRRATADIHVEAGTITLEVIIKPTSGTITLSQVFLFKGGTSPKNGKQVQEAFLGMAKKGGAMMTFAKGAQAAQFKQVTPAGYSVCVLPINGDIRDAAFRDRLQKHADKLLVHCRPHSVTSTPDKQSVTVTVPPMAPLPAVETKQPAETKKPAGAK